MDTSPYTFTQVDDSSSDDSPALPPNSAAMTIINGNRDLKQRAANLADSRYDLAARKEKINETLQQHDDALKQATGYYALASHIASTQQETEKKLAAADFLSAFKDISHTDPDYEAKVAALAAANPMAGDDPMVKQVFATSHAARQIHLQTLKPIEMAGGANAYQPDTPERHAFESTFGQTQDLAAAHGAAQNTKAGEEMIRKGVEAGTLDLNSDFPSWDGEDDTRPKVYNPDGSMNYHEFGLLAATRAAQQAREKDDLINTMKQTRIDDKENKMNTENAWKILRGAAPKGVDPLDPKNSPRGVGADPNENFDPNNAADVQRNNDWWDAYKAVHNDVPAQNVLPPPTGDNTSTPAVVTTPPVVPPVAAPAATPPIVLPPPVGKKPTSTYTFN